MVTCDPNERKKERYLKELLSRKKKRNKVDVQVGKSIMENK
jgi:hypothetical protein